MAHRGNFHSLQGERELTGVPSVFIRHERLQPALRLVRHALRSWNPEGQPPPSTEIVPSGAPPVKHTRPDRREPMIRAGDP